MRETDARFPASRVSTSNVLTASTFLAGSLAIGFAVASRPALAVAAAAAVLSGLFLLTVPLPFVASLVLVATIVVPSVWVEANTHALPIQGTPLTGQAGVLLLVGSAFLARVAVSRIRIAVPGLAIGTVVLYSIGLVFSALVASLLGNSYPGMYSDLLRQMAYPGAFLVGALAVGAAGRAGLFTVIRSIAGVGIAASLLSLWYWLWSSQGFHPGLPLFADVLRISAYTSERSIFPFAQDSPNVGAVAFVLLGSFAGGALLRSPRRLDVWLALCLLASTGAAVLTTQSRTGLVALGVAGLSVLFFDGSLRRRPVVVGAFLGLAVLVVGGYLAFSPGRRFSDTQNLAVRQSIWYQAFPEFTNSPIVGQGYRFSGRDQFYEIVANPADNGSGGRSYSIHNDYLEQLVDGGAVGFSIFAVLLAVMFRTAVRLSRSRDRRRDIGIGYGCQLAALGVSMGTSSLFESAAVSIIVWLLFGIVSAAEELS